MTDKDDSRRLSYSHLDAVWGAIHRDVPPKGLTGLVREIVRTQYVSCSVIEDWFYDIGLGCCDRRGFCDYFALTIEPFFSRPKANKDEAWGFDGLSLANFAGLLIHLSRAGVNAGADLLVEVLRPGLRKRVRLTHSELMIYWYPEEKNRMSALLVAKHPAEAPDLTWPDEVEATETMRVARFTNPAGELCLAACPKRWGKIKTQGFFAQCGLSFLAALQALEGNITAPHKANRPISGRQPVLC